MLTLTINFYIMASLKFILKTQKEDKSGKCPLYIRLIQNRKTTLISTGIKLEKNQWDEDRQKVKKNYPNSTRLNAILATKLADYSIKVLDEERKAANVTANKLKKELVGKNSVNFFKYAQKFLNDMRGQLSYNTYFRYENQVSKFKNFIGSDELYIEDISVSLIKEYNLYNTNVLKNKLITVKSSLQPLSSIYNSAINEGLIDRNSCPFDKIKFKVPPSKRRSLSNEQFSALKNYECIPETAIDLYRNLFLFAVSAGGLRYHDLVTLKWKNIDLNKSIITRRISKTGRLHRLKMGQLSISILQKYMPSKPEPEDLVFPVLPKDKYNAVNQESRIKLVIASNVHCNKFLKKIGEDLKFPFHLHFHLSRHTFATQALNNGMRIEYVSKLMDHSKITTTQIYAKVMDEELDKAVDQYII